jgi:hypothetical protein
MGAAAERLRTRIGGADQEEGALKQISHHKASRSAARGTKKRRAQLSNSGEYVSPISRKIFDDTTRLLRKALRRLADK